MCITTLLTKHVEMSPGKKSKQKINDRRIVNLKLCSYTLEKENYPSLSSRTFTKLTKLLTYESISFV